MRRLKIKLPPDNAEIDRRENESLYNDTIKTKYWKVITNGATVHITRDVTKAYRLADRMYNKDRKPHPVEPATQAEFDRFSSNSSIVA